MVVYEVLFRMYTVHCGGTWSINFETFSHHHQPTTSTTLPFEEHIELEPLPANRRIARKARRKKFRYSAGSCTPYTPAISGKLKRGWTFLSRNLLMTALVPVPHLTDLFPQHPIVGLDLPIQEVFRGGCLCRYLSPGYVPRLGRLTWWSDGRIAYPSFNSDISIFNLKYISYWRFTKEERQTYLKHKSKDIPPYRLLTMILARLC